MPASTSKIPEKMINVAAVPTAGIERNVGTNVPMMLPIVFAAPSVPTVFPLSSRLSTEYFTSEGVTVPSRNSGYTNTSIHERNAAQIRKFVLTVTTSSAETSRITSLPANGIAAVQTAETSSLE